MQEQKFYNLTNPQKSIIVTEEFFNGSTINNICGTSIIKEKVNLKLLEKSIIQVLKNNEIFKIKFCINNNQIQQYVSDYINSDIIYLRAKNDKEFTKIKNEIVSRPFHLLNSHPYNFYIIVFPNRHAAFSLNIHHVLADSWALGFISKQVVKTYCALLQMDIPYEYENYPYTSYINSEQEYKKSERFLKDKSYWNKEFETIPNIPFIPGSIKDSKHEESTIAKRLHYSLSKKLISKIKKYCEKEHISLYNFFMAVYGVYIRHISGLDDFVIGSPILNRTNFQEKNTSGVFINMAAFRLNFSNCTTFKDFVKYVTSKSIGMLKHQKYPYQLLIEDLKNKHENISTLYNVVFSYHITNTHSKEIFVKYTSDWTFNGNSTENINIHIFDLDGSGNLTISYDYKTSIYSANDISLIHERILHLIEQIVVSRDIDLNDLGTTIIKEKKLISNKLNHIYLKDNFPEPLIHLFKKTEKASPKDHSLTFDSKSSIALTKIDPTQNSLYKILAVDDEIGVIDSLAMFLKHSGYNFVSETDTRKAIERLKIEHFDLLLLAFPMTTVNCDQVIEEIRKFNKNLYILLLTRHNASAPSLKTIRYLDIQGYCEKSDNFDQLLLLIESGIKSVSQKNKIAEINEKLSNTYERLEQSYMESIQTVRYTVEAKDTYTRGHSDRVSEYSVLIGEKLGLDEEDIKKLRIGGLFHDVGKIGIPDNILQKEGRLTDDEYSEIKKHPSIGYHILSNASLFQDILPIVKHHHERYDGKGYPEKLKGEAIPYLARITSVADAFDAMTSRRVYRDSLSLDRVIKEFENNKGTQFDPQITDVFLDILRNNYNKIKEIQDKYIS